MTDATPKAHVRSLLGKRDSVLRKRRSVESRLKAYGITAIMVAGLALFWLMGSVVFQASGAVTESYVTLPVELDAERIDPEGTGDPKTILRGKFGALTKEALRVQFPTITARREKRELYDVVSVGAAFELAEMASANPDLVGQTIDFRFLASDVTDLYLKGDFGNLEPLEVRGLLSIVINEDEATILSSESDFAGAMTEVRNLLLDDAKRLRLQAARQNNAVRVFRLRAENATDDAARQSAQDQMTSAATRRDQLLADAEALETRARSATGREELDEDNRSIFVRAGGGWLKITEIDAGFAKARVLIPPTGNLESLSDWTLTMSDLPESSRKVSDVQIVAIEELKSIDAVDSVFNWRFFSSGDSREPELAGIWGAVVGSFWTMLVTFFLAFPIGVAAAIYLEEFAPRNRFTDLIEVNINNLAAVPSIIFGLLGLSVFLGVFGVPRSAPIAGGIVLALMTLPTIIIAARAAIKAVPPSIREAALGVGASNTQASFHHVLPLAMPGILTGTIIGMAQALGETAPLIMIGMVAFIVDIPGGVTDSASVLPVQVFRWSDFPERAFEAKTGAAICVLMVFLILMNAVAIVLRRRFERRW
ncbi:MAG: phosphate ABC transporter permease PstA [Boseongicola sp.]